MKKLAIILSLIVAFAAQPVFASDGPYFTTIASNYKHPVTSAGMLLRMDGSTDGGAAPISLVWHKGDIQNTLLPEWALNAGIKPISWDLLACGGGYASGEGTVVCGSGVNAAPTVLGPLASPLEASNKPILRAIGSFIANDKSGGLNLGYLWNMRPIQHGTIMPVNHWGTHLDAFLGASYSF